MTALPPTRICFVAPNLYPVLARARDISVVGGAEFRQSMLARAFAAGGFEVSVVTQDFGQADDAVIDGVKVLKTCTPQAGVPGLRYLHPRLSSVIRRLREVDADIYYQSCASHLTGVVAWHCQRTGAFSIYGGASDTDFMRGAERMKYARDRWLLRWGLENVDAIVAQTERQASLVRKYYRREASIIPNPYARPVRVRSQRPDLTLWVGGIRPVKRPDRFLALARARPQYRFRMIGGQVGGGADARAYFALIRDQAATLANLEFLGFLPVDDVEAHFDEARILVNTSEHEGFPNTFLQAWARGTPTVSYFDAGAPPDGPRPFLLVNEQAGALVGLDKLLTDVTAWGALSSICQAHFSARHSTAGVVAAYGRLVKDLGTRRT